MTTEFLREIDYIFEISRNTIKMKLAKILICLVLASCALGKPLSDKNGDANIEPKSEKLVDNILTVLLNATNSDDKMHTIEETGAFNKTKLMDYEENEPEKEASTKSYESPKSECKSENDKIKMLQGRIDLAFLEIETLKKLRQKNIISFAVTITAFIMVFTSLFIIIICLFSPCCCCNI